MDRGGSSYGSSTIMRDPVKSTTQGADDQGSYEGSSSPDAEQNQYTIFSEETQPSSQYGSYARYDGMYENEMARPNEYLPDKAGYVPPPEWRQAPGGWRGSHRSSRDYVAGGLQQGYGAGYAAQFVTNQTPSGIGGFERPDQTGGSGGRGGAGDGGNSDPNSDIFGPQSRRLTNPYLNTNPDPAPPDPLHLSRDAKSNYTWMIRSFEPKAQDVSLILKVLIVSESSGRRIPVSMVINTLSPVNLMKSNFLSRLNPRNLTITKLFGGSVSQSNTINNKWISMYSLAQQVSIPWKQNPNSSARPCEFFVPSTWEHGTHELVLGNDFLCTLSSTDILRIAEVRALVRKLIRDPKYGRISSGFSERSLGLEIEAEEQRKTDQFLQGCVAVLNRGR